MLPSTFLHRKHAFILSLVVITTLHFTTIIALPTQGDGRHDSSKSLGSAPRTASYGISSSPHHRSPSPPPGAHPSQDGFVPRQNSPPLRGVAESLSTSRNSFSDISANEDHPGLMRTSPSTSSGSSKVEPYTQKDRLGYSLAYAAHGGKPEKKKAEPETFNFPDSFRIQNEPAGPSGFPSGQVVSVQPAQVERMYYDRSQQEQESVPIQQGRPQDRELHRVFLPAGGEVRETSQFLGGTVGNSEERDKFSLRKLCGGKCRNSRT